jgi:hypothetical protein
MLSRLNDENPSFSGKVRFNRKVAVELEKQRQRSLAHARLFSFPGDKIDGNAISKTAIGLSH